ncbi:MAG: cupin domain-containing protein [Rhodospirillaceae bacterium]|jgi:quercetin dioxygenase-like cupin family protein|nr:cupin domain-containing protein [Rhodospirillaceae bacterium]MBT4589233.1 cupin domain-containing protein [Rhodospirillaceae bacterium]MBT4939749.1 cupin domain-containing protein [Rhodospirillaceae bacterium]MBT5940293.1 cupin domain-containing protein [Rhodospirillaceae bacterium]MBT7268289.1 cupin domain-containing protein [Rhodospirillaceae bacterium]
MTISPDDIAKRTARFKELNYSEQGYLDTRIPAHKRNTYNVIGRGVTEDDNLKPAIAEADGFNITYIGAEPGCGAALHDHPTVEVFIAMTGKWAIIWGDEGEHETIIDQFDVVSVPPGVMRGFRNESDEHGFIMAILGGSDSGHVSWAKSVVADAEKTGLRLNEDGSITELT